MSKQIDKMKGTVIYDQAQELAKPHPEFNSDVTTPHCQLGNEVLNANVPWLSVLFEVLSSGRFTLTSLCGEISADKDVFIRLLDSDVSLLNFKIGARLLSLHESITLTISDDQEGVKC